ncbi:MAG: Dabb family protein [Alphaproteobacteria bacterium]|nr:Dabb family protein [Alphaproteobacteria bacterium]
MIRHIVMFNAKKYGDDENIEAIYNGLKMLETIKGDWSLKVIKNKKVDHRANDMDIVVYGEFPDETTLAYYKTHPTYQKCTALVRPLRNQRIAVDIPDDNED